MTPLLWEELMNTARRVARANLERARVIGVKGDRRSWTYILQCSKADCHVCRARRERG